MELVDKLRKVLGDERFREFESEYRKYRGCGVSETYLSGKSPYNVIHGAFIFRRTDKGPEYWLSVCDLVSKEWEVSK